MDTLRFNLLISKSNTTDDKLLKALESACFYNLSKISNNEKIDLLDMKL